MVLLWGGAQWAQNNGRIAVAMMILRLKSKMHSPRKNGGDGPGSARREDAGNIWRNGCDGLSEFFQAESRRWGLSDVKRRLSSDGFGRNAPKAARVGDVDKNDPFRLDRRSGMKPPLLRN